MITTVFLAKDKQKNTTGAVPLQIFFQKSNRRRFVGFLQHLPKYSRALAMQGLQLRSATRFIRRCRPSV
jgi:hypothetical protein